jgi:hypothetical protein
VDEWIKKMGYRYSTNYYSASPRKGIPRHAITWMNPENTRCGKGSQSQKMHSTRRCPATDRKRNGGSQGLEVGQGDLVFNGYRFFCGEADKSSVDELHMGDGRWLSNNVSGFLFLFLRPGLTL